MAFFRCVFVDEFGHTVFPADITADNLETAKRHAYLKPRIGCQTAASVDRGKVVPWTAGAARAAQLPDVSANGARPQRLSGTGRRRGDAGGSR